MQQFLPARRWSIHLQLATFVLAVTLGTLFFLGHSSEQQHNERSTKSSKAISASESVCDIRLGPGYLNAFAATATNYCDDSSDTKLTCFAHKVHEKFDTFCIGEPAYYDDSASSLALNCNLRRLTEIEIANGHSRLDQLPTYWYDIGPRSIFRKYLNVNHRPDVATSPFDGGALLLVLREASRFNLWHTMMEIMALSNSIDVLQQAIDQATGKPFLDHDSAKDSQIVFLDGLGNSQYDELWTMVARKPTLTISELDATTLTHSKVVVPLPGSANPLWQGDWVGLGCEESELLRTFSRRVLDFYDIADDPLQKQNPLTLTFIDRKETRRLVDQDSYMSELISLHPNVNIQMVDFAAMPLSEQIRVVHSTDILAGPHGAAHTHTMFLPANSTVVEILPSTLQHRGYEMVAQSLGHRHFSRHGSETHVGDWHADDIYLDKAMFLDLMARAIGSQMR